MEQKSVIKKFTSSKSFSILVILIVLLIVFSIINANFHSLDNLRNIMYACSLTGVLSVGMGVLLISGNVDLSAGAVGCMGSLVCAWCMQQGLPWGLAALAGIVFGAAAGAFNAFVANVLNIMPFIGTLAMASAWQGFAAFITNNRNIPVPNESFWKLATTTIIGIPSAFWIMLLLFIIYGLILTRTSFGTTIYIMGGNPQAAHLAGINTKKVNSILMINCSAVSALAGVVYLSRLHTASPSAISGTEMDGITALVLGGVSFMGGGGGMMGGFIGLLMLKTFQNGLTMIGFNPYWQTVASGGLLFIALVVDYINTKATAKQLQKKSA
jgi:ribose/xylose/arabinose/galactoside ABC-type transport system permease subunit